MNYLALGLFIAAFVLFAVDAARTKSLVSAGLAALSLASAVSHFPRI